MAFDPFEEAEPQPATVWGLLSTTLVILLTIVNVIATFLAIFTVPFVLFGSFLAFYLFTQFRRTIEVRRRDEEAKRRLRALRMVDLAAELRARQQ